MNAAFFAIKNAIIQQKREIIEYYLDKQSAIRLGGAKIESEDERC